MMPSNNSSRHGQDDQSLGELILRYLDICDINVSWPEFLEEYFSTSRFAD